MKQEILEATSQNTTPEKKYKVLNIKHFYNLYLKEKVRHDSSLFSVGTKTKSKRKRFASYDEYCKIIRCYLEVYFYELYFRKIPSYFFLLGIIRITISSPWRAKGKNGKFYGSEGAFGLFWYLRPSEKSYFMVKLKKLTGKHNMIPKIENSFAKQDNKDLLPTFTEERRKALETKTLFRCIQT
jgi:hypothetical protein